MENRIFDKDFDMDKFIEKRMIEITDLEERKQTRKVMTEVFREIYRYTGEEYRRLEEKIEDWLSEKNAYVVKTGIVERKYYDETDEEMFPMRAEDLEEVSIDMEALFDGLEKGNACRIYSVFLEAGYETVKKFSRGGEHFSCRIKTLDGEYQGSVYVRRQERYQEMLRELFDTFQSNGVPWKTVCAPYLYKIFDVYLESADVPREEQIECVEIDFREYDAYVRYDTVPVWNIEKQEIIADVQPEPCEDRVHYVHTMNTKRLDEDCRYLVVDRDVDIYEVRHKDDIEIISAAQDAKKWTVYRLTAKSTRSYDALVFTNECAGGAGQGIRTQAGIFKYISGLGFGDYAVLKKISFPERLTGEKGTYAMDEYLAGEIKIPENRRIMLLEFENRQPDSFLSADIMSYLVTVLQSEYREYRCIGTFF